MKTRLRPSASSGFTVIEIAIVLVVAGLLLGGALKGQELINGAKTRAIIDRQSELQKSALLFFNHFGAMPGDLENASTYITDAADGEGDGFITENESPLALQHLAASGFLRCGNCTETSTASSVKPSAENSPINRYGGVMSLWHDSTHYAFVNVGGLRPDRLPLLQTHTGPRIASNLVWELDRKLDDGVANRGFVRFNNYDPTGADAPPANECTNRLSSGAFFVGDLVRNSAQWRSTRRWPPIYGNCGGSIILRWSGG